MHSILYVIGDLSRVHLYSSIILYTPLSLRSLLTGKHLVCVSSDVISDMWVGTVGYGSNNTNYSPDNDNGTCIDENSQQVQQKEAQLGSLTDNSSM